MRVRLAICVVALSTLAGCFVAYDYGDHQLASGSGGGSSGGAGQGAGAAGGGGGGGGGTGGAIDTCAPGMSGKTPGQLCRECYASQCVVVLEGACTDSAKCAAWYGCTTDCCDPECYRTCDEGSVMADSPLGQVYECMCDMCGEECQAPAAPPSCP